MPFKSISNLICRYSGFRRRTFITKGGMPRLRYVFTTGAFTAFCAVSVLSAYLDKQAPNTVIMPDVLFQRTFPVTSVDIEKYFLQEQASAQDTDNIASDLKTMGKTISHYFNDVEKSPLKRFWTAMTQLPSENLTEYEMVETKTDVSEQNIVSAALTTDMDSKKSRTPTPSGSGENDDKTTASIQKDKVLKVKSGDTLAGILQDTGIDGDQVYRIVQAINKVYDPRHIQSGQTMSISFAEEGTSDFQSLKLPLDNLRTLEVVMKDDENINANIKAEELHTEIRAKRVNVKHSLYQTALNSGIPSSVISKAIHLYSWDIDFQRDVRRGDELELLYEVMVTKKGKVVDTGDLLYASIETLGKKMPVYRYALTNGQVAYFEPNGSSLRKALMQTPVDGARISSGYGMRKHPVLGYSKMHKGVDFAAPTGTPVYAAGDGVIEKASRFGSYGNYVRIKHMNGYKTAYAHLNGFGKGIKSGVRVEQGDVIGYIGSTGRSTGPHLHYEVLVNDTQVNPRNLKLPKSIQLAGKDLEDFNRKMGELSNQFASLVAGVRYAQVSADELTVQ